VQRRLRRRHCSYIRDGEITAVDFAGDKCRQLLASGAKSRSQNSRKLSTGCLTAPEGNEEGEEIYDAFGNEESFRKYMFGYPFIDCISRTVGRTQCAPMLAPSKLERASGNGVAPADSAIQIQSSPLTQLNLLNQHKRGQVMLPEPLTLSCCHCHPWL
jgi:hypothetical protein